jgi:integration host factor subunit beta
MTRSDLVAVLAERFGQLTQRDTEFAVKTILDAMSDALARGHRIEIRGFARPVLAAIRAAASRS